jgi:hypothetical protein
MTCTQTLAHIVGSAFSQALSSSVSPITEGGGVVDVAVLSWHGFLSI